MNIEMKLLRYFDGLYRQQVSILEIGTILEVKL